MQIHLVFLFITMRKAELISLFLCNPVIIWFPPSGSCSVMSRRKPSSCSQVNPTSQRPRWPRVRRRWLKCAAWSNTSSAMQTNVRARWLADPSSASLSRSRKRHEGNAFNARRVVTASLSLPAGGPRLKCSELLKHVMEVLQSPYYCAAYGEHYSSLLLKDVLSVRKYWCDIPPQEWHGQWV